MKEKETEKERKDAWWLREGRRDKLLLEKEKKESERAREKKWEILCV